MTREERQSVIRAIERRYPKIGHLTGRDFTGTMIDKLADAIYKARWGETVAQTLAKVTRKAKGRADHLLTRRRKRRPR